MRYLTPHFTYEELIYSEIGQRRGIDNTPSDDLLPNLQRLAELLEQVRTLLGGPIHVNSGYRCEKINEMVGSKKTSDHLLGLAADFVCPSYGIPDYIVRKILASGLSYKQVIREFDSWVHISVPKEGEAAKKEALIIDKSGTRIYA